MLAWLLCQVEGELVSRAGLEALHPEQFSSVLILADESTQYAYAANGGSSQVIHRLLNSSVKLTTQQVAGHVSESCGAFAESFVVLLYKPDQSIWLSKVSVLVLPPRASNTSMHLSGDR